MINPSLNKVCSVIVSYNSPEELKKCIESCFNQVDKIVVVDNSTNSEAKEQIARIVCPDAVEFIINNQNLGLGSALNQGIMYSMEHNYEWTLLLDQDSVLLNDMVCKMINSYEKLSSYDKEQTVLVAPTVYDILINKKIPSIITTRLLNKKITTPDKDMFIHFHITSGSLVKNKVFRQIGLMNELFFIDYIDYDFCFRVISHNYKILLSKSATLQHSLGEIKYKFYQHYLEHNPLRVYYQTRNRLAVMSRYGRTYKSFLYAEIFRFLLKWIKILLMESSKIDKFKAILKGGSDFFKVHKTLGSKKNNSPAKY